MSSLLNYLNFHLIEHLVYMWVVVMSSYHYLDCKLGLMGMTNIEKLLGFLVESEEDSSHSG